MKSLRYTLPSVRSLLAFEAAARCLNFSTAAAELDVTPSAISKSIHSLEDFLGIKLFVRRKTGLELTEQGDVFFRKLSHTLESISGDILDIQRSSKKSQEVRFVAARFHGGFFAHALLPRLHEFTHAHPHIRLILEEDDDPLQKPALNGDLAYVRGTPDDWRHFHLWKVADELIFPVCSPHCAERVADAFSMEKFHTCNLLEASPGTSDFQWRHWLKSVLWTRATEPENVTVLSYTLTIQAALRDEGIALAWEPDVIDHLRSGALCKLGEQFVKTGQAYFVIAPKGQPLREEVLAVVNWATSPVKKPRSSEHHQIGK